jgi:hypothetical protein
MKEINLKKIISEFLTKILRVQKSVRLKREQIETLVTVSLKEIKQKKNLDFPTKISYASKNPVTYNKIKLRR